MPKEIKLHKQSPTRKSRRVRALVHTSPKALPQPSMQSDQGLNRFFISDNDVTVVAADVHVEPEAGKLPSPLSSRRVAPSQGLVQPQFGQDSGLGAQSTPLLGGSFGVVGRQGSEG
jgi:hypothetical protein